MSNPQLSTRRTTSFPSSSSFLEKNLFSINGVPKQLSFGRDRVKVRFSKKIVRVHAMSSNSNSYLKMNLNEYMVTLEKPLGIRFALTVDGKIFVHALRKGVIHR